MSKIVEAFEKLTEVVKAQFGENAIPAQPTVVEENFMSVKTVDGTVINLEGELAVGAKATVVMDGNEVPAPEGEHTLEDGTKILIKEGVVSLITPPAAVEAAAEPVQEAKPSIEETLADLSARIAALEAKLATSEEMASKSDFASVKKVTDEMYNVLKGLVETPAAQPIERGEQFSAVNKRQEKIKELSNILKQL